MPQTRPRAGMRPAIVLSFAALCLAVVCLIALPAAWAQAAGQYTPITSDLRGRWAGVLLGATDQPGQPSKGAVESFRFEAEIREAPGGWQMTLTRAPYDPGVARQPITATFPLRYDARGWLVFSVDIPNRDGKLVTLEFKGQTNLKGLDGRMAGRGFHGTFNGASKAYANRMIAGRITDAPGIAPILPGVPAAELARWPVTLAQYSVNNRNCGSSDDEPPALLHVDGDMAVYTSTPIRSGTSVCILHDTPLDKPLYAASNPYLSDMSAADKATLDRVLLGGRNTTWKAGIPAHVSIYHFVKNEHLFNVYNSPEEDAFFWTQGDRNSFSVLADDLRAAGGAPLSPGQFLAARKMQLNKATQLAAKNVADAPMLAQAAAEADAARAARRQTARATRASLARKHGFIFHDDAYWAGVDYDPRNGEEPGADLREIFEGRNWAEQGSPLASAYLTRYVQVTGDKCGKTLNWPSIRIKITKIDKTMNGLGTVVIDNSSVRYWTFHIDPLLYDEFNDAIDPAKAKGHTIAEGLKMTMDFLRGESTPLQVAVEQHTRAQKSIGWLVEKEGCVSPTTRQLAMNLKMMAQGKPSLQAKAIGAYGSRNDGTFYTENGFNFFGAMRVAKETMALKPIVADGKTYSWQDLLRINGEKIARNKRANRAWWHPVIVRDDAGDVYVIANRADPESEGDEVIRAYVVKVSRSDIDAWRSTLGRHDISQRLGRVRAETELMKLKIVRLLTYEGGGVRVTADQDYPDFFERARTPVDGKLRPQTVAAWLADPLH